MKRDSFIFYASFYNAIKEIPNENQLKVYQAITNFALTGEEPTDLNGIEKAVFILVKPQIIANNQRYINGCGGGRPKKEEKTKKKNTKKTNGYENRKPKQPVAVVKKSPQAVMCDYFKSRYKANTGLDYLAKAKDYTLLAELIKEYGPEQVKQKIEWLEVGCKNRVFWFTETSGINSFTIGKLYSQWNEILPMLTEEQRRQQEQKKKEEESMKRVLANVKKLKLERESWKNE